MEMERALKEAATANSTALAAEKVRDAAEAKVEELKRVLDPKRQRTDEADGGDGPTVISGDWDLADHRREMTRVMNRHAMQIGSKEHERELRTAKDADPDKPPVAMIVNSSEVRAAGFKLKELMPDSSARAGPRTQGAGVRTMEGMGEKMLVLDVRDDNYIREGCE